MHRTMRKSRNGTNIMHHLPMYPRRGKKSLTMPRQRRPNNSVTMTYEESRAKLKQQIVDTETSSSSNESRYDVRGTVGAGLRRARKVGQVATTCEEPSGQVYVVRENLVKSLRRARNCRGRFTSCEESWSSRYDVRGTVGAGSSRKKKQGSSSLATAREAVRHTRQHGLLMRWQRDRVESLTRHEKQIPSSKHISKINKTGRMGCPQAGARSAQVPKHAVTARAANHDRLDGISTGISTARALAAAPIRTVLFIFPSRYLFAIGLTPVFSLGRNLPPYWGCIPKQPDSQTVPRGATGSEHDGALTLSGAPFQGTWARSVAEDASPDYNSDSEAARFSSWAIPGSLAVTKGILVSFFSSAY
ncbi:hypothetical protein Tco_0015968 [Tanacetum coccineum]